LPELPEVETVVRSIAPHLKGHVVLRAEVRSHRVTRQNFRQTEAQLTGATILGITRHGKQINIQLDRGTLYVHLGMTGKLLWNAEEDKFTRAVLDLDNGTLQYNDIRQFGRFEFFTTVPELLGGKGPDALTVEFQTFHQRLKKHRGAIKAVLLNQAFIAGVGNIYADEILFAAAVHPRTPISRISVERAKRIHQHTLEILAAAVQMRGSSISDYVDSAGEKGGFQNLHQVYGRAGSPCERCGRAIRRIVIAQRGTHYCPGCQRA
jgi:formamidopyrimidine-DNA glycosylase